MRIDFVGALLLTALPISVFGQGVFEKRLSPVDPSEAQRFHKQTKVAVVVGVSQYPFGSGFAPLKYAASDAAELGETLKQQGYLVTILTDINATRGSILNTLRQMSGVVDPDQGTFLFYFSGHGFAIGGKNYLAPISASESDLAREGLDVDEVENVLSSSKARRQLMLLDACRNDVAAGSKGNGGRSFSAFQAAEGLRILNSTRLGRVSYESDDLRHGVFTAFVLDALHGSAAGMDGLVTFHDLSDYVTDAVRRWGVEHARIQVPFETVGKTKEASGDFLLATVSISNAGFVSVGTPTAPWEAGASEPPSGFVPAYKPTRAGDSITTMQGLTWVWIPPGSFLMGCSPRDSECNTDEKPHKVTITKAFEILQTPVTQGQYQLVMGNNPSTSKGENLPVVNISWNDAKTYCEAIHGTLPTEAQWEYAARAGTSDSRYGDLDSIAWYSANSGLAPHPVGTKTANAWNLFDMLGNVWQWTADWYGVKDNALQESTDPQGPPSGTMRVLRGGSWLAGPTLVRVSDRHRSEPAYRDPNIGCRCVRE